jgi:hypothetical protein
MRIRIHNPGFLLQQVSGGGSALPPLDTIRRDEVNAVLANQRELVSAARDIKNFVTDVHSKVTNIQAGLAIKKTHPKNPPKNPKKTQKTT